MNKNKIKAAIIAMSVFQMGTNALAPVLSRIKDSFPGISDVAVQQLITLPNIFVIAGNFLATFLAKKFQRRTIASAGCLLFALAGICSFLFHRNFSLLLLLSMLTGCGIGLMVPVAAGSVSEYFLPSERPSVMGYQTCSAQFGGACITILTAMLSLHHWYGAFLAYLIALPGFFLTLWWFPRTGSTHNNIQKTCLPALLSRNHFLPLLLSFGITMLFNVLPANISIYIQTFLPSYGRLPGTASALLLLSGAIGALWYGRLYSTLKNRTPIAGFGALMTGLILCGTASSPWMFLAGCIIGGCSISLVMPYNLLTTASDDPDFAVQASAMCMIFSNLGGFSASLITLLSPDNITMRFMLGAFLSLLFLILLLFLSAGSKIKDNHANAE